jgi:hypothetical protein
MTPSNGDVRVLMDLAENDAQAQSWVARFREASTKSGTNGS